MLFKQTELSGIRSGNITTAFRKWKRPTVKTGSLIQTAIGRVEILEIKEVSPEKISNADAIKAGYPDKSALIGHLAKFQDGTLYRIRLRYHSADPRLKLRAQKEIPTEELEKLRKKLERMDNAGSQGPWTHKVLRAIQRNPELRAADLAAKLGVEKDWLKPNVRKLKNLGLTISLEVGYRISPLGEFVLKEFKV